MERPAVARISLAVLIGFLFLLPHLVRMAALGSVRQYTPFSAASISSTTWDETFLYAPEANYILTRHALTGNFEAWRYHNEAFPYSILSSTVEAAAALLVGGMIPAHILLTFLFPSLTAWLLMGIFLRSGAPASMAAALALIVLVIGFSPRTVLNADVALVTQGFSADAHDTLQGSRNPNPNMSFPLYLGAVLCLVAGLHRTRTPLAPPVSSPADAPPRPFPRTGLPPTLKPFLIAGLLGGALFYAYTYYALGWSAALLLLGLVAIARPLRVPRAVWLTLAITSLVALPLPYWRYLSGQPAGYLNRATRLGLILGHRLVHHGVTLTLEWGLAALAAAWLWRRLSRAMDSGLREQEIPLVIVLLACIGGAILGMNMQVVTGFNVQPEHHYPHMILQPICVLLFCLSLAELARRGIIPRRASALLLGVLFVACAAAQVESGVHTAPIHRMSEPHRDLFLWLNRNTATGDIVSTTDLRLNTVIPLYTHDGILLEQGSRSEATNEELLDRYFLASRLAGESAASVETKLAQPTGPANPVPLETTSFYLFETAPYEDEKLRRIKPEFMPALMERYTRLDLAAALARYRTDYVWLDGLTPPADVSGWRWAEAFRNADGILWHAARN